MAIAPAGFYGVLMRRNTRTAAYCKNMEALMRERAVENNPDESPEVLKARFEAHLAEEPYLLTFSVAMNGADLDWSVEQFERRGMRRGEDFVVTASPLGVMDALPTWLRLMPREQVPRHLEDFGPVYEYAGALLKRATGASRVIEPGPRPRDPAGLVAAWLKSDGQDVQATVRVCEPFSIDLKPAASDVFAAGWAVYAGITPTDGQGEPHEMTFLVQDGTQVVHVLDGLGLPAWAESLLQG